MPPSSSAQFGALNAGKQGVTLDLTPQFMVPLLTAALDARDADLDGRCQHLDFAQAEAAIHFIRCPVSR
ncbi:hypothetical protein [Candidatus Poriferisodalis sp.]|uniref:hypothetical protein n=1 Tax=Candidatus Poriferisodalis sp. TaxID=3101277 RepID=UPI003B02B0FD